LLKTAPDIVRAGGTAVFISFHSLEDRAVKHAFKQPALWERLSKKPLVPSAEEHDTNPRARSAKLRAARRVGSAPEPRLCMTRPGSCC
jgi:16S rRNA (cytosine1402-N4)-methyltransferase